MLSDEIFLFTIISIMLISNPMSSYFLGLQICKPYAQFKPKMEDFNMQTYYWVAWKMKSRRSRKMLSNFTIVPELTWVPCKVPSMSDWNQVPFQKTGLINLMEPIKTFFFWLKYSKNMEKFQNWFNQYRKVKVRARPATEKGTYQICNFICFWDRNIKRCNYEDW